jgi:hypothetical protein
LAGHRDVADVEVEIEVGRLDPVRQIETERHLDQLAPIRRQEMEALFDLPADRLVRGRRLEDRQAADVPELGAGLHRQEAGVDGGELLQRATSPIRSARTVGRSRRVDSQALAYYSAGSHQICL